MITPCPLPTCSIKIRQGVVIMIYLPQIQIKMLTSMVAFIYGIFFNEFNQHGMNN